MKRTLASFLVLSLLAAGLLLLPTPPLAAQSTNLCDETVAVSVSSGTTGVVVTGTPGYATVVCSFVLSADTIATTGTFKTGTGTTCGTGTVSLTGAMRFCDECAISHGNASGILFRVPLGSDFCLTTATGALTGFATFGRH